MSISYIDDDLLTDIADAIRTKASSQDTYTPAQMATAIENLPSGGGGYSPLMVLPIFQAFTLNAAGEAALAQAHDITPEDIAAAQALTQTRTTNIGQYAFYRRQDIRSIEIGADSGFNTIGNYAFYGCKALRRVTATRVREVMGNVFENCTALEEINLPFVTSIYTSAFKGCSALTDVIMTNLPAVNSYLFENCTALEEIELAKLGSGNSNANAAFKGCTSLQKVTLGGGMSLGYARYPDYIGQNWFNGCTALTQLILPGAGFTQLSSTNAFTGTPIESGTGYIYVHDNYVSQYQAATNWATFASQIKGVSELPTT